MLLPLAALASGLGLALVYVRWWRRQPPRVLVVGSINVDLYQRTKAGQVQFGGRSVSLAPVKGMTLPAASFAGKVSGIAAPPGKEEKR